MRICFILYCLLETILCIELLGVVFFNWDLVFGNLGQRDVAAWREKSPNVTTTLRSALFSKTLRIVIALCMRDVYTLHCTHAHTCTPKSFPIRHVQFAYRSRSLLTTTSVISSLLNENEISCASARERARGRMWNTCGAECGQRLSSTLAWFTHDVQKQNVSGCFSYRNEAAEWIFHITLFGCVCEWRVFRRAISFPLRCVCGVYCVCVAMHVEHTITPWVKVCVTQPSRCYAF